MDKMRGGMESDVMEWDGWREGERGGEMDK